MHRALPIRWNLSRWQPWALIITGVCLIAVMHQAYATIYTEPDLQVWWMAVRLWLAGINPYGPAGDRVLGTGSGFAYPFPAVLFCLPLAPLSLPWASTVWALMSMATVCAMPFALHDRPDPRIAAVMLAYFPLWASLEEGQWGPALLLWGMLSCLWLRKEQWLRSGAVASLVLLKPNVGLALLAGLVMYALHTGAPRRWWMGLACGLLVFWVGTQALAPGWPLEWFEQIRAYDAEDQNRIDAASVVGALAGVIVVVSAILSWRRQKSALLLAGVVTAALLLLPTRSFYNHVVLLLPIALLPLRIAIPVVLISWGVLIVPAVSADIVLARSLILYLPLAIGLAAAVRQIDTHRGEEPCAS